MTVLDTIKDEHRLIRHFIDNIEIANDFIQEGAQVPEEFFTLFHDFTKSFMDAFHHFKEEYVLFLKLAEKKGGEIDPQIVSLRDQHERGRNFVKLVKKSVPGYLKQEEAATAALSENLGYFVLLQKQHLNRENHVFIPMARKAFSDKELQSFAEEFKKQDKKLGADVFK
ncbi:hemerythrin domain-containing protein, partial [bacterium]|nr:hemerythrin domain-containing protein [bacterium]